VENDRRRNRSERRPRARLPSTSLVLRSKQGANGIRPADGAADVPADRRQPAKSRRIVTIRAPAQWLAFRLGDLARLEKALTKAELPKMRFHDLRHTHCSLLISEGLNVVYVSRSMGHASPDITLKTYSHMWDAAEHAGKASAALDAVYTASS
jgi:integrase